MTCKGCGKSYETSFLRWQNFDLCKECFDKGVVVTPSDLPSNPDTFSPPVIPGCVLGILLGGFIGYLLVPLMPFVGKLPLGHILTRGIFLEGLDTMLVSVAETSFNYMLVCAILGGVIGIGLAYLSGATKRESRQKSGEDIAEQLKKLAGLREQKIVTEEEFQAKKSELLKRL